MLACQATVLGSSSLCNKACLCAILQIQASYKRVRLCHAAIEGLQLLYLELVEQLPASSPKRRLHQFAAQDSSASEVRTCEVAQSGLKSEVVASCKLRLLELRMKPRPSH